MRLDQALVQRGISRSRTHAAKLISEGRVRVAGTVVAKASHCVDEGSEISAEIDRWVSRAAHKLLGALDETGLSVPARVLDAGASTGGFTQVCIERGAAVVYAVDVGHGQLAPELRADKRVKATEGRNVRDLNLHDVDDEPVGLVVGDLSFISLGLVLANLLGVLSPDGEALLLVKPQFEVGKEALGAGGVVRDERLRAKAVDKVAAQAGALGWRELWRGPSCLPGAGGNVEFFIRLGR